MKVFREKYLYLIFTLIFIVQLIVISPIREFPLNDDWVHNWAINNYLTTGQFIYPAFLAPTMHLPILWGIIFGKIFGFSFSLMSIINLLFAFATIIVFFKLLKYLKVSGLNGFLLSLALWFNPIFLNLSYTSMGDIPTLFMLVASIFCFYVGLDKKNYWFIFWGALLTVAGFFIRQYIVLLLVAVGIFVVLRKKEYCWSKLFIALGVPFIILLVVYIVFNKLNWLPEEMNVHFFPLISYTKFIIIGLWRYILLFSLFLLPLSLSLLVSNIPLIRQKNRIFLWCLFFFFLYFCILGFILFLDGVNWFSLGNIINFYGLGPNIDVLQGQPNFASNMIFFGIINFIAICSFIILLTFALFLKQPDQEKKPNMSFMYWLILLYGILFLVIRTFDRYLLMILPAVLVYFSQILKSYRYSKVVFSIILSVMLLYGGLGVHDYLAWNRIRWDLGNKLLAQGVPVQDIEGGYEWNGWHLYNRPDLEKYFDPEIGEYLKPGAPGFKKKYVISFSPLTGYQVIDQRPVKSLISRIDYIYLNMLEMADPRI